MRMWSSWRRLCGVIVAGALAAGLIGGNGSAAEANRPNIAAGLASLLAERGTADMVVEFKVSPDLSPAFGMSWEERGEFVVRTLQAANDRVQAGAIRYLAARNLRHEAFLVGNLLYVHGGDAAAANALAELPDVATVREPITINLPPVQVNDTPAVQGAPTWGLTDSKATTFWTTFGTQGDGIVVANIDSGVQYNHPALVNQFKCPGAPADAKCWKDPSNVCGAGGACDNNGHGTHTMGTMVADDNASLSYIAGMAPGAKWIACKGCESSSCSEAALNSCADWVLSPGGSTANRPHVVNNSWGGGGGDTWYKAKVQAWQAAGLFPAFSAGNSGSRCSTLGSPGDYQESFGSAAHDQARAIASFSSRGPSNAFGHDPYTKPNISAPGVGVWSTVPTNNWASYNGTSMASPHTAGAVALLWACNPALKGQIDQTIQYLQNSADAAPAGNCGAPPDGQGNYTFGYGYLNVLAAGEEACGGTTTPALHVQAIVPTSACRTRAVSARADIFDNAGQPAGGASVTGTWTRPNGSTVTVTKSTAANGQAKLATRASAAGEYRFCVAGVTKAGFTYDAGANVETCDTVSYACN